MNSPKLRFSGFNGPWTKRKLSDMTSYTKGYAFKSKDYSSNGERIIRVSDLLSDSIRSKNEKIFIEPSKLAGLNKYRINQGEIIVTTVGSKPELRDSAVGRAILVNENNIGYLNQNLLKLETGRFFDSNFIYKSISGSRYLSYIENIQRGNANQANITVGDLMEFPVFAPDIEEQKKVGSFFLKLDQKISLLTKKHELLTKYKKGVMQKIFNLEIRFKDGDDKDFPNWEPYFLKDKVLKIGSGGTPKSTNTSFYGGDIPWVSIADMTEQGKYINSTKKTLSNDGLKNCSAKLFPAGTVLYAMYASIGECSIANVDVATSQAILGIQAKEGELDGVFLYHWLSHIKDRVVLMGQQGTQSNLNLEIVKNFELKLPCIDEQIYIKDFLNTLDKKIELLNENIKQVKQYQQGLLQQMFI